MLDSVPVRQRLTRDLLDIIPEIERAVVEDRLIALCYRLMGVSKEAVKEEAGLRGEEAEGDE